MNFTFLLTVGKEALYCTREAFYFAKIFCTSRRQLFIFFILLFERKFNTIY